MRWLLLACCALLFLAEPVKAQSVTRYTNTSDSATNGINDTSTPCSNRYTRTITVSDSFAVTDVEIGVLAAHTYRGDLVMYLVSPNGTRVQLTAGSGSVGADNFNVRFDDEASASITTHTSADTATSTTSVPPYANSFIPAAALSAFDGQNSNGNWVLEICDQFGGDSGTFYQADLYLTRAVSNYADLSLAMSISSTTPAAAATITYTLTIANSSASPDTATGVTVSALLPTGVNFTGWSGGGSYNSTTGVWTVGTLAPGANATLTLTGTVNATSGASVAFAAEVASSSITDLDSTPGNGVTSEDDYASRSFTVSGTRTAGTAPSLSCSAGTTAFDWDSVSWTAGSTSGSYSVTSIGSIGFSIVNPGAFLTDSGLGGQSPTRTNAITGAQSPAQYSLVQLVNMSNRNDTVNTTITLGTAVPGLQFRVFDVDFGSSQFSDKITVTGSYNGTTVLPTLTNGVANYVIGNSAYGDAVSSDTQSNGNVTVTFSSPVDTILIAYGNHSTAPSDPGNQAIAIHDITFCKPVASISVSKVSSVISDPVNGTSNPKAIPGAVVEYCILVSNTGPAAITSVAASDALPSNFSFSAGTIRSGSSCASAATTEDEDASGSDETDGVGVSVSGGNLAASASSISAGSAVAVKFRGTLN